MLIVLPVNLMSFATASGEWNARPTGYVLEEPSIVGSIEDGRVAVEKIKGQEARIEATENALIKIEEQVRIMSIAHAETQKELKQIPDLIKQVEADFAKTLRKEKAKSASSGLLIGLIAGVGGALLAQ